MDDDHALFGSLADLWSTVRAIRVFLLLFLFPLLLILLPTSLPLPVPPLHRQGVPVHPDGVYAPQMSAVENTDVCTRVLPRSSPVRNIVRPLRGPRVRSPPSDVRRLLSLLLPAVLLLHPLPVCLPPAASPLLPLLFCRCTCHPCLWSETTVDRSTDRPTDRPTNPPSPLSLLGQRLMCSGKGSDLLH